MTIHYQGHGVTLHHGDCLDVLRTLPDASVDSVVTDPPYGLEFMGKGWDAPWQEADVNADAGFHGGGISQTAGLPSFTGSSNPKCLNCKGTRRGRRDGTAKVAVCLCVDGGRFPNTRAVEMRAFGEWCEAWATECLRVLKPGGHLLAFGGTRTWHRLACAVEDAGFEVRDSIAWLYGSGFPKSLDVSKAIDKAAGAEREVLSSFARKGRSAGILGTEVDIVRDVTAPATPEAEQWQGWGTALKPAFEPVVVARKPLASPDVNVLDRVEWELRNTLGEKEIRWTTRRASGAAKSGPSTSSSTTPPPSMAAISAAPADASATANVEPQTASSSAQNSGPGARRTASTSAPTAASNSASSETPSSKPMAASVSAATSGSTSSSPSTTSTAEEPDTVRKSDDTSTPNSDERATPTGTASSVGTATGLTGSRARVLIERLPDGSFIWPEGLPRFVKGGPLTVAATVLAHGTGALNIDGCRVGMSDADRDRLTEWHAKYGGTKYADGDTYAKGMGDIQPPHAKGRWPANVVLDESQAESLDEQSGEAGGGTGRSTRGGGNGGDWNPTDRTEGAGQTVRGDGREVGYGDMGGASRFFYVAKADASERPRVNGTAHPTVKPLSLMRWLVRLVTPPGGTVLEPFAGSGTTVEACIIEGFQCIAIEREADYLPLIRQRIDRRRDPVEALRGQAADLGLFDLLGGEGA